MGGGFPFGNDFCAYQYIGNHIGSFSNTEQDSPTAAGTLNTKTSWQQLVASTSSDITAIKVINSAFINSTAGAEFAFDIGVGGSGSENTVINNIIHCVANNGAGGNDADIIFPINIPSGSRVSMRYQNTGTTTGNPLTFAIHAYASGSSIFNEVAGIDAIGVTLIGLPYTISFTPGHDAAGAWTQVVASTSRDYIGLALMCDNQAINNDSLFPIIHVDIAIGAAAAEQIIIQGVEAYTPLSTFWGPFVPVQIPAGSRLSVRGNCNDASPVTQGIALYGAYQ